VIDIGNDPGRRDQLRVRHPGGRLRLQRRRHLHLRGHHRASGRRSPTSPAPSRTSPAWWWPAARATPPTGASCAGDFNKVKGKLPVRADPERCGVVPRRVLPQRDGAPDAGGGRRDGRRDRRRAACGAASWATRSACAEDAARWRPSPRSAPSSGTCPSRPTSATAGDDHRDERAPELRGGRDRDPRDGALRHRRPRRGERESATASARVAGPIVGLLHRRFLTRSFLKATERAAPTPGGFLVSAAATRDEMINTSASTEARPDRRPPGGEGQHGVRGVEGLDAALRRRPRLP
jgi:hypothetical protein